MRMFGYATSTRDIVADAHEKWVQHGGVLKRTTCAQLAIRERVGFCVRRKHAQTKLHRKERLQEEILDRTLPPHEAENLLAERARRWANVALYRNSNPHLVDLMTELAEQADARCLFHNIRLPKSSPEE